MMKTNQEASKFVIEEARIKLRNMSKTYIEVHCVCGMTVKDKLFSDNKK